MNVNMQSAHQAPPSFQVCAQNNMSGYPPNTFDNNSATTNDWYMPFSTSNQAFSNDPDTQMVNPLEQTLLDPSAAEGQSLADWEPRRMHFESR